jgi:hypothetical protein
MKLFKSLTIALGLLISINSWAVDTYNASNNQLTIPLVQVGSTTYNNVVITVGDILFVGSGPAAGTVDSYTSSNNQLVIPSVLVGTAKYYNVVITVGNIISVGGSAPTVTSSTFSLGNLSSNGLIPSMTTGSFTSDGAKYVVVAGWSAGGANADVPVKIYKINGDGTGSDVTVTILGSEKSYSTNYPIVADFNHDGIDDLFLGGFHDFPANDYASKVFLSQQGQPHKEIVLPGITWNHGIVAADINRDGNIDVINSLGQMWLNDGKGNFTFHDHNWNLNTSNGLWMHGMGVCVGDFNNTGRPQVLITDLNLDAQGGPIQDTGIFELDSNLIPTASHILPVPVLDRNSTTTEISHDVTCRVADINGDGKLDVLVFSRPLASARNGQWTNEGVVQTLINNGNWQFTDTTDTAMVGYPTNVLVSYTPYMMDLNGDGKVDLFTSYFDQGTGKANMAWINNGLGIFTRSVATTTIDALQSSGPMVPVLINNSWVLVYSQLSNNVLNMFINRPQNGFTF